MRDQGQRGGVSMALLSERTRRGREKVDRVEVRGSLGRPGDRGELVARVALRFPLRFPRRVRKLLAEGRPAPVRESAQRGRQCVFALDSPPGVV